MTAETKIETPAIQLFSEMRGKYILIKDNKSYIFEFSPACSLNENFEALKFLEDKVIETIELNKKKKEEAEKAKEEVIVPDEIIK